MRVLVIEDNEDMRTTLQLALGTDSGVDVVLTHLFMPEMDGIEVIATLKRRFPGVRVVAMSGRPGVDYLGVGKEPGAARILRKPFEMEELLSAVVAACPT